MDKKKIKRIIAREGLLFLGISIVAFMIAQNHTLQDWIVSMKAANPNLSAQVLRERFGMIELGEIILRRAAAIGFLSILLFYGFIRFVVWAIKMLKEKE